MDEIEEIEAAKALQQARRAERLSKYTRSQDAKGLVVITSPTGRSYTMRKMGTREHGKFYEALGCDRAGNSRVNNSAVMTHYLPVFAVLSIDGQELPTPNTYPLLEDRADQIPMDDHEALLDFAIRGDHAGLSLKETAAIAKN